MCYFIIERQLNIEYIRVVALFVLRKFSLKKMPNVVQTSERQNVSCFGNSFMATECSCIKQYVVITFILHYIRFAMLNIVCTNDLFSTVQHVFTIAKKSCCTQLMECMDDLKNGRNIDVICLDFHNAFERVPHKRLLKKVPGYVIRV